MLDQLSQVTHLHLELSSRCNSRCARCPRNFYGFPYNKGYIENDLSLAQIKDLLQPGFLSHVRQILVNGNFGDFVMNPESVEIIKYLRENMHPSNESDTMKNVITISTNGSARDQSFWRNLGQIKDVEVVFCIDGLEDTHKIYRQDTDFHMILDNSAIYMSAGGKATWMYTIFPYNQHQVDLARKLSEDRGFSRFQTRPNDRADGPIYDRKGRKIYSIGKTNPMNLPDVLTEEWTEQHKSFFNFYRGPTSPVKIRCQSLNGRSLYIDSLGRIFPCCYLGFQGSSKSIKFNDGDLIEDVLPSFHTPLTGEQPYFPLLMKSHLDTKQPATCQFFCGDKQ